jgi:hypothetical protein
MECRKCTYFDRMKASRMHAGQVILGFCRLRQKHVSDSSIGLEYCKDKAVVDISEKSSNTDFVNRVLKEDGVAVNAGAKPAAQPRAAEPKPPEGQKTELSEEEKIIKRAMWR